MSRAIEKVGIKRSTFFYQPKGRKIQKLDSALAAQIKEVHKENPAGYKKLTLILNNKLNAHYGAKKIYRYMKHLNLLGPSRRF